MAAKRSCLYALKSQNKAAMTSLADTGIGMLSCVGGRWSPRC
jgi:hypothetical protein